MPETVWQELNFYFGKEQEAAVQKTIQDRAPDQLKMPFALWTRQAVQELIRRQHGIKMPIRTVGEYLMLRIPIDSERYPQKVCKLRQAV